MNQILQKKFAQEFLKMHNRKPILRLANAWDVASAKIFELAGAKAIGTTSSGMSAAWGYPDGENIHLDEMLQMCGRMAMEVPLPLSVDLESGFGKDIKAVLNSVDKVLKIGAVGINIEDVDRSDQSSLYDMALQIDKLKAIRERANSANIPLVINARTDVFLLSKDDKDKKLSDAIARGNHYREAGADCIFIVGTGGLPISEIKRLVQEIDAPINIYVGPAHPPIEALEDIGVARVSFGAQAMRSLLAKLNLIAEELLNDKELELMFDSGYSDDDLNRWFQ